MAEVQLEVQGVRYEGWKSVRVTRSMTSITGTFDLEVHDRFGQVAAAWPIREEDACRVIIDEQVVIDGFVDRLSRAISARQRTLRISGKDKAAALVECSVPSGPFTLRNISVEALAQTLARPFDIDASVADGLSLEPQKKVVIGPGESPFAVLTRVLRETGALVVSSGGGGIIITRAATSRAEALQQGSNVFAADFSSDAADRFRIYTVLSQSGDKDDSGQRVRARAVDLGVRRTNRVKVLRPERGQSAPQARARADWEARIRAARAESTTVTVVGWRQRSGVLWPVNALVSVEIPAIGVSGTLLITDAEHSLDQNGSFTRLRLMRPDAFTPATAATVASPEWKL